MKFALPMSIEVPIQLWHEALPFKTIFSKTLRDDARGARSTVRVGQRIDDRRRSKVFWKTDIYVHQSIEPTNAKSAIASVNTFERRKPFQAI
jgi:hypothetical protein